MRSKYRTRQREMLLDYLKSKQGMHVTAAEICDYFHSRGLVIGTSTIYRNLESFVAEGVLKKYIIDEKSPACFEYAGEDEPKDKGAYFHCKCEKCGKLIHIRCNELEKIGEHLQESHSFHLDQERTVFYGICEECI